MIALWFRRLGPLVLALAIAGGVLLAAELHGRRAGRASAAHQATVYAESYVYATDTLWRHDTVALAPARGAYRVARDVALRNLKDTASVKAAFAKADNAIALDSSAVASAAKTIRARDTLVVRVRDELAIARVQPRLTARALALYDPIAGTPAASLEASLRVVGRLSLVARADQRFALGERPRAYVGAAFSF